MKHSVMYEYVHCNYAYKIQHSKWVVFYEPLDYIPVIRSSLSGTTYFGEYVNSFVSCNEKIYLDGKPSGSFDSKTGVVSVIYEMNPEEIETYLCVSYQSESDCFENIDWIKQGF